MRKSKRVFNAQKPIIYSALLLLTVFSGGVNANAKQDIMVVPKIVKIEYDDSKDMTLTVRFDFINQSTKSYILYRYGGQIVRFQIYSGDSSSSRKSILHDFKVSGGIFSQIGTSSNNPFIKDDFIVMEPGSQTSMIRTAVVYNPKVNNELTRNGIRFLIDNWFFSDEEFIDAASILKLQGKPILQKMWTISCELSESISQ